MLKNNTMTTLTDNVVILSVNAIVIMILGVFYATWW